MGAVVLAALVAASRIVITEVMTNPKGITGIHQPEDRNEFIELYNPTDSALDLLDWTVDDGDAVDRLRVWTDSSILNVAQLRIGTTWLDPGCYAVVLDPEYTDTAAIGGYIQPYHFGPNALILTVGNTTLGDGLTTTDPVTLVSSSAYGCEDTSTFGTPADPTDSIPRDPGEGISWERVDAEGPDAVGNWAPCRDTSGSTPGAANSSTTFLDLAVTVITLADTSTPKPGEPLLAGIGVANSGFRTSPPCSICVFLDRNGNGVSDAGEYDTTLVGAPLQRGEDTTLAAQLACPIATTDLCARLVNRDDDTTNDFARVTIRPDGSERMFDLNLSSFSPDGDGFEETLAVLYRLPEAKGTLQVKVFDLGGRQVATIFSGRPPAERGVVCWNGLKSSGAPAPTGIYAVFVEYRSGGTSRAEKLPVVLLRK